MRRCCFLMITGLLFFLSVPVCWAFKDVPDCLENLTLDKIDFSKSEAREYQKLLGEYLLCLSASRGGESLCSYVSGLSNCDSTYNLYHNCYGRMAKTGKLSQKIFSACKNTCDPKDKKACESPAFSQYYKSIAEKDVKGCEGLVDEQAKKKCIAVASRDANACYDGECRDMVRLFEAVEKKDVARCKSMERPNASQICIGIVSGSEKSCRKSQNFLLFKNYYCQGLFKRRSDKGGQK